MPALYRPGNCAMIKKDGILARGPAAPAEGEYPMAADRFVEGVAPGGLVNADDIKILLCYLLKSVQKPLSFGNLNEILQRDSLCNYFGFAGALRDLLVSGHVDLVKQDGEDCYKATRLGRETAALFERRLPLTVREKAMAAAVQLLARIKRESENRVEIEENGKGGCTVTCSVLDMGDPLLRVSVYVPERDQAEAVKKRFQNDPQTVYRGVLALLTGDVRAAAELAHGAPPASGSEGGTAPAEGAPDE